jgi:hypothetical protein
MTEGEVIQLKSNNVAIVRLDDDREIEVAINKSVCRRAYKISIGDRFAIKIIDPPRLSRVYALIKSVLKD